MVPCVCGFQQVKKLMEVDTGKNNPGANGGDTVTQPVNEHGCQVKAFTKSFYNQIEVIVFQSIE